MGFPQAQSLGRVLCLALCAFRVLLPDPARAAPQWAAVYSPVPNIFPDAQNVVLGQDGSVYTSGYREGNWTKYALILKYSPTGERLWVVENTNIWVAGDLHPVPVTAVDSQGAVRIAGPWTVNTNELIVASYSAQGTLLWERRSLHNDESRPYALSVDSLDNTIVVGRSYPDALVVKYSPDGTMLWTRTYPHNSAQLVLTLPGGDILVGLQWSAPDGERILKYNSAGDLLWAAKGQGEGILLDMKPDPSGNIMVLTRYEDALFKLSANGQPLWRTRDLAFQPAHLTVDPQGSIYVAGYADSRPDYANTRTLRVAKYDSAGGKQWTSHFAPPDSYTSAPAGIAVNNGGVSIACSVHRSDFLGEGAAVAHYDHNGVEVWRGAYDIDSPKVRWMAGDADGGIYVAATGWPNSALYTLKFRPTVSSALPVIISPPRHLEVVSGTNSALFSVEAGNGPNTFQWRRDGVALPGATNATLRLSAIDTSDARSYSVIVSNAHGFVVTPDARLTVRIPEPTIRVRRTPSGIELTLQAWPGKTYRLQRATTLGTWTDLQTFTPQTGTTIFTDTDSFQSAFYRLVSF